VTRYKSILLIGSPGAGKGTVGRILGHVPGFFHVACGEVFRSLDPRSELGREFIAYSSKGQLVPDDLTIRLWHQHLRNLAIMGELRPAEHLLVLDGIPRNVHQARLMESEADILLVCHLDCPDRRKLADRIRQRSLHENRLDDINDEIIQRRFRIFDEETKPVLDHYRDRVVPIDAARKPFQVLRSILDCFERVERGG